MSETVARKWIRGGCRKCKRTPAENHGRGLCAACYGQEYDAGRIRNWPKLRRSDLVDATPRTQQTLGLNTPENDASQPLTVTLQLPPEGRPLWTQLEDAARRNWRTTEQELLYRISQPVAA